MEEYHGFYHGFWAGFWAEPVGLPRDPMSITVKHQAKQNETQMLSSDFMFFLFWDCLFLKKYSIQLEFY